MKKQLLAIFCPALIYANVIDFQTSLTQTLANNKELKAKKLNIEKSKIELNEAKGYNYGTLVFNENIVRTNHAGYVFGMKMSSKDATFRDFGFSEFLGGVGQMMNMSEGDFNTFSSYMNNPSMQDQMLETKPEDLNNPNYRTNFETKVTYQLPIFTGFKLSSAQKMAKLQVLAKSAKYNYDEKNMALEVLKAYNGAVAAKEFIKATKKAKKATNSFVEFANELYKEGIVTNIDVKQAKVYDLGVDAKMIEAQNSFELAVSYLKFLTNNKNITDVSGFKNVDIDTLSLANLKKDALQNRDDFKWMKHNTKTMEAKIDFESAQKYPMIGAQLEYGYNDERFTVLDAPDKDYYMAAVGISFTLFDGAVTRSKEQKAKIAYNKTMHYFEYMKEGIKLEVEKNVLNLKAKNKILTQKIKAQNLADEVLLQSEEMYKNHLINMSNLLMQQANQQKANAQTILAKFEQTLAAAQLKISLGQSLQTQRKDK
ncbi:MAG: TolC family protein [Campylobacterota bacterium]|nr:TolC family protein [Campylobacterota bacterium]